MTEIDALLEQFDALITQFEKLFSAVADKTWLPRPELHAAQQQFKSIKDTLEETTKQLKHGTMTELERRFFYKPLEQARTHLHAKWNSNPFNSNWIYELGNAQTDLRHGRFDLAEFKKKQH
jgi:hypothetical protein